MEKVFLKVAIGFGDRMCTGYLSKGNKSWTTDI